MARYKHIDTSPRFLAIVLEAQLMPGTFEHALHRLLEHDIDLSGFDARFGNDETGAPAYPPAMLLEVVLLAYSRGIVSSRAIERACREHVTFIALTGDSCPHFTTIAAFVSGLGDLIGIRKRTPASAWPAKRSTPTDATARSAATSPSSSAAA